MKILYLPPEPVSTIIAQAVRISTLVHGFELRRVSRKPISDRRGGTVHGTDLSLGLFDREVLRACLFAEIVDPTHHFLRAAHACDNAEPTWNDEYMLHPTFKSYVTML